MFLWTLLIKVTNRYPQMRVGFLVFMSEKHNFRHFTSWRQKSLSSSFSEEYNGGLCSETLHPLWLSLTINLTELHHKHWGKWQSENFIVSKMSFLTTSKSNFYNNLLFGCRKRCRNTVSSLWTWATAAGSWSLWRATWTKRREPSTQHCIASCTNMRPLFWTRCVPTLSDPIHCN